MRHFIRRFLPFCLLLLASFMAFTCQSQSAGDQTRRPQQEARSSQRLQRDESRQPATGVRSRQSVPAKVHEVLRYIRENNRAPEGYVGGRRFGNYEGHLPRRDLSGEAIRYQEWDVNPKRQGRNRGAERLVTGSDGRAWYTRDHYNSFLEVK